MYELGDFKILICILQNKVFNCNLIYVHLNLVPLKSHYRCVYSEALGVVGTCSLAVDLHMFVYIYYVCKVYCRHVISSRYRAINEIIQYHCQLRTAMHSFYDKQMSYLERGTGRHLFIFDPAWISYDLPWNS